MSGQEENKKYSIPFGKNQPGENALGGSGASGGGANSGSNSGTPDNSAGAGDSRVGKVSLPVGGGAIRGIGEKFEANPVTGTASFSVPLAMSEGRGGFTPQLALSYDSGSGNSAFGLGWNIGLPSITRKTDKGLPQYNDNPDSESDVFILSGAEDLVPVLNADDSRRHRTEGNYDIYSYRPRIEGLFATIERWVDKTTHISHWRSLSKDNITSIYGYTATARIADSDRPKKIFSWLLEESRDAKGNDMLFAYKQEDRENVPQLCYEATRNHAANLYIDRVLYGNKVPNNGNFRCLENNNRSNGEEDYLFKLEFDYGMVNGAWTCRQDPFSNYRAGFEIRTYRLCRSIKMYHQFTELGTGWTLTRATALIYDEEKAFTLLKEIRHIGYNGSANDWLPPLAFSYTESKPADSFKTVPEERLEYLPAGVDGERYQWADLYSEGLSGIIAMQNEAWYFMPNYGDKRYRHPEEPDSEPAFGGMRKEIPKPAAVNNSATTFQLGDVNSDGLPELILQGTALHGFYSKDVDGQWLPFRNFAHYPNISTGDANLRFMDLSGDGLADIVISTGDNFDIYFSEGVQGYGNYRRVRCGAESGVAPQILFSDAKQRIFLADMSGDGLTDIVRITSQSVVYWPNMGYGRFGEEIVMSNPPLMDTPDGWDARHVFLADVDGTGTTDLLYISSDAIRYWKNLSGNAWEEVTDLAPAIACTHTPQTHIQLTDLLGNGTQCLVVSSSLPSQSKTMRYWELTNGIKPFLLNKIDNSMGGITKLSYAPSTKFYIQGKFSGKPWITRLPFPVQVLEQVEITDLVAETKFTSRYAYHHGYYDHAEREFRGFGMVEQWDAEHFDAAANSSNPLVSPPVYTKTWFHTGFFRGRNRISRLYEEEYYNRLTANLPDTVLPGGLSGTEAREACRALKGSPLRIETYAQDGSDKEPIPYSIEEKNYSLRCLQHKRAGVHHAVFLKSDSETLLYHFERNAVDPRILHTLTLRVDDYGNPVEQIQIAYPRRTFTPLEEQNQPLGTYTETRYINHEETATEPYRYLSLPCESKQYEIRDLILPVSDPETSPPLLSAATLSAETLSDRPLFSHTRRYFWNRDVGAALPLGSIASQGLLHHSETLELTQELINLFNADGVKITNTILVNECRYINDSGNWFKKSEIQHFAPQAFYQPDTITDPFDNVTRISYDSYGLFPVKITDALDFETTAKYDYRVLQPCLLLDPNRNSQAVAFNALGMVTALALMGKNGEGDTLSSPTEIYDYNLHSWQISQRPCAARISKRETHADPNTWWINTLLYTAGLGKVIMTKTQCADGNTWEGIPSNHRWLASGKTILDNKGNPVMQYEPWFSDNPEFEYQAHGVTPIMHYDPPGRLIQTDFPDGTIARVEFDAWQQKNYDQNDCDPRSPHYNTPQVIDMDVLGRAFQTRDDNGSNGAPLYYITHNKLDITGRPITVTDAKGRAMTQNLFGFSEENLLTVNNIDSGKRWLLNDAAGNPVRKWDGFGRDFRYAYDPLQRPTDTFWSDMCLERLVYGTNAQRNDIGRVTHSYGQDGYINFALYDFKGNPLQQIKCFVENYQVTVDCNRDISIGDEFPQRMQYNALNRLIYQDYAYRDNLSSITYGYDRGGLLNFIQRNSTEVHISNIEYNEKQQRLNIYYGNDTTTGYKYDERNFRLLQLVTARRFDRDNPLQDLNYSYDAVGNIIRVEDKAQQRFYFDNQVIAPTGTYTYDALYRLISATGRELTSLAMPSHEDFPNDIPCPNRDPNALQNYTQKYEYDEVGNIKQLSSDGSRSHWVRDYRYDRATNRLLGHRGTTDEYYYDDHGNITGMPHLHFLRWDYRDQFYNTSNGTYSSFYSYDAQGNRTRKVIDKDNIIETRFYINGFELYRKERNGMVETERESLHILNLKQPEELQKEEENNNLNQKTDFNSIFDTNQRFVLIETLIVDNGSAANITTVRYQYGNHLGSACLELDETGRIVSYEEYHPFGTTSYRSGRSEIEVSLKRYKYVGKERDNETGLYYYGARYYAAWLGRWCSCDPLADEYPNLSPYNYCANNPVRYTDPTGMVVDDYVFNQEGKLLRIDKNDKPDRLVIENSKTGARQSYQFADPVNDPKDIANGTINRVEFVSSEQVANFLSNAGAFNPTNRENEWGYLKTESKGGKALDFSYSQIPFVYPDASTNPLTTPSPMLFIPEGDEYAHNHMNFGNFLWGAAGHSLGFSETTLKLGAHFNSVFNSRTNGYGGQLDSKDDQLSIIRGINFSKTHNFRDR